MVLKRIRERYKMPLIRMICFFIVLFLIVSFFQCRLQYRERYNDNSSFQIINFYKEKKNSLDAVLIGSSCTFAFYSPLFAYENYGIKTTNYSSSGMGMLAYRYAIEEVRKNQKDALIILTITPNYEMQYLGVHFMSDYMPMSLNKIRFLTKYFTQDGESILNSLGFYFTLMEYHDRWSQIGMDDLIMDEGIKGATRHKFYLSTINDISESYVNTDEREEMPKKMASLMIDLLDYCDQKKESNIVFLLPPKSYSEEEYRQMNALGDLISSRGYQLLDLRDKTDEIFLDKSQDYYDVNHTNIHGSIKYTDYIMRYILSKRDCNVENDKEWNDALDKYHKIIEPFIIKSETDMSHRDYQLAAPKLKLISQDEKGITLSWQAVEGADGYFVYRKVNNGFVQIGETADQSYVDKDIENGFTYVYTVSSYRNENGETLLGNYDYKGIEAEVTK